MSPKIISREEARDAGLKRYFTGKPCKHGHICERSASNCECSDCAKDRCLKNYYKNIEYYRERQRKYTESGMAAQRAKEFYHRNREISIQRSLASQKRNPDRVKAQKATDYQRRKKADGAYKAADIKRICEAQKGKCAYCKADIRASYSVDHIKPITKGGTHHPSNLQLTCKSCNSSKNNKSPEVFAREIGLLI